MHHVATIVDDLFSDPALGHRPLSAHPERPERAAAVARVLGEVDALRLPARPATMDELARVHTAGYLGELERTLPGRAGWIDADTYHSERSWDAALAAAGAATTLALASLDGRARRGFAAVRPPGHHATADQAMGFCLLNNVAVAAAAARAAGAARVAIVDWDVHHGNGTEAIFDADPAVLYVSTHQSPLYPGTGPATHTGAAAARGATINVPLPEGSGDQDLAVAFDRVVVPALRAFRPDLILVSAGFDLHEADPLAGLTVSTAGVGRMAAALRALADEVCDGRIVCVLEGGYDLGALAACARATMDALIAPTATSPSPAGAPTAAFAPRLDAVLAAHAGASWAS